MRDHDPRRQTWALETVHFAMLCSRDGPVHQSNHLILELLVALATEWQTSAECAARFLAKIAMLDRQCYQHVAAALRKLGAGVQPTAEKRPLDVGSIAAAVFAHTVNFVFEPPRRHHCSAIDGHTAWATDVLRWWQRRLRLPECHFGESSSDTLARFKPDRRLKPKEARVLTETLAPLAQWPPVSKTAKYETAPSCWDKYISEFPQTPTERLRAEYDKSYNHWIKYPYMLPVDKKGHSMKLEPYIAHSGDDSALRGRIQQCALHAPAVKLTDKYEKKMAAARRRLPVQGHVPLLGHLNNTHKFTGESGCLYKTARGEALFAYANYASTLPMGGRERHVVTYDDALLTRVFKKGLSSMQAWHALNARLPNKFRAEVHHAHDMDEKFNWMRMRPSTWAIFVSCAR
jgi:hypothetical protein